jgi:hypothetical protein
MEPIPKAGFFYANRIARITIIALESVMGKNGMNAVLNIANQRDLIDNYPPDNLNREFDFADFSSILLALEDMFGPRGGRSLTQLAGRSAFAGALSNFGAMAGVSDTAFKSLPLPIKLRIGLPAMAKIFSQTSDQQATVAEHSCEFIYTIHRCPVCWGRKGLDKPVCFLTIGLLQEGLKWISGGLEFRVHEDQCVAMGDEVCGFIIQKEPISQG